MLNSQNELEEKPIAQRLSNNKSFKISWKSTDILVLENKKPFFVFIVLTIIPLIMLYHVLDFNILDYIQADSEKSVVLILVAASILIFFFLFIGTLFFIASQGSFFSNQNKVFDFKKRIYTDCSEALNPDQMYCSINLNDVNAIQLIHYMHLFPVDIDSNQMQKIKVCELNLIDRSNRRRNVVCNADIEGLLQAANQIGERLGVPILVSEFFE